MECSYIIWNYIQEYGLFQVEQTIRFLEKMKTVPNYSARHSRSGQEFACFCRSPYGSYAVLVCRLILFYQQRLLNVPVFIASGPQAVLY